YFYRLFFTMTANGLALGEEAGFSTNAQSKNQISNIAQKFQSKTFARYLAKPMLQAGVLSFVLSSRFLS
ncbi:hypothetical protein, partial [Parapedobacter soli]|uniref:hypothetical protein n=1 Tax=Parapedobacter soli TaxID=416955 RepID=UPI0021C93AA5